MLSHAALLDALAWQVELGATDAICEQPIDRYALPDSAPGLQKPSRNVAQNEQKREAALPVSSTKPPKPDIDPVAAAQSDADAADSLEALRSALATFDHCALKQGARQLVFSDGTPGARVMIIGEAPGRDEDQQGKPFVGRAGQLLDKMLGAIDLSRSASETERAVYITNILPWRPPQNRDPKPDEIAMMKPFVRRHVDLAKPDVLIAMGNISCQALLGKRGITRLRGDWTEAFDLPCLPMFHPAYLLRQPSAKREAWADLLTLAAHLEDTRRP
ncbi:MAG: uracil-DNA glycosylase [Pseudomonadota bacterium]